MKPKQLALLAAVFALLLIAGVVVSRQPERQSLEVQGKFVNIMPDSIPPESVNIIEVTQDKTLRVKLQKSGGDWRIASAWNAPAKKEKIEELLSKLKAMKGDLASENPKNHASYGVDAKQGVHIRLFTAGSDKPALNLIMGKNRGYDSTFVRLAGDKTVYDSGVNLRSMFDMWGDDAKPKRDAWLRKNIVKVEKDKLRRVELKYPDHVLVFARQEKANKTAKGKDKNDKQKKKEYEWKLVAGGPGGNKYKQDKFKSLLSSITSIDVRDVQDPKRKKELGLDKAPYLLTMNLEGDKQVQLAGVGKPDGSGEAYVTRLDGDSRLIYSMAPWTLGELFPKGKDLFELSAPKVERDKVTAIRITREEQVLALARKDAKSDWQIQSPATGFKFKQEKARDLLDKLAAWNPLDYASPAGLVKYGLSVPVCTVQLASGQDKPRIFKLGKDHPTLKGAYVSESPRRILVMEKQDKDKAFPNLGDFFDLGSLLEIKRGQVTGITLARHGAKPLTLVRVQETAAPAPAKAAEKKQDGKGRQTIRTTWYLRRAGKRVRADQGKVNALLDRLVNLQGEDLLLGSPAVKALDQSAVLTVALGKEQRVLKLGATVGKRGRAALASNRRVAVVIAQEAAEGLLFQAKGVLPTPAPQPKRDAKKTAATKGQADKKAGSDKQPATDGKKKTENDAGKTGK